MNKTNAQVIIMLKDILADKQNRYSKVSHFVTMVMTTDKPQNGKYKYSDYINELAYDLDFYDPNVKLQKKYGFYGDDKLEEMLNAAIEKLGGSK